MNIPLETVEQQTLANWLRANNYIFYKSPSETYTTSWKQKRKNTLEGVTKGYPDICIILKRQSLLFIEMKRQRPILKNGKIGKSPSSISEEQKVWIEELNKIKNVGAQICYGANEAINLIQKIENEL